MQGTPAGKSNSFKDIVSVSSHMQRVYDLIGKVADTDSTVLITGESGTGKELIARTIHNNNSTRSQALFVPLNCAAIPKDLLESELFGHERGAFTGALNTRVGRFELADKGTLFLDEIGDLEPSLQVKLLRVLQEMEFERVGGVKTIKVDVRVLAATNKDLEQAVHENRFREDLYYRLNVIPIHLSPVRERQDDIPLLLEHFVEVFSKKRNIAALKFSREAMECLLKYRWPGNVREVKNLIERLTILVNGDTVRVSDLPEKLHLSSDCNREESSPTLLPHDTDTTGFKLPDKGIDLNAAVVQMERSLILKALEKTGGVRSRAATLLGLNRTTLIEKMKKMGMANNTPGSASEDIAPIGDKIVKTKNYH